MSIADPSLERLKKNLLDGLTPLLTYEPDVEEGARLVINQAIGSWAAKEVVPIKEVVDELRALASYPFDPARKVSNKRRMEDVLDGVMKYASRLELRSQGQEAQP